MGVSEFPGACAEWQGVEDSQQLVAMAGVLGPEGVVGAPKVGQGSLGRVCCVRREEGPGSGLGSTDILGSRQERVVCGRERIAMDRETGAVRGGENVMKEGSRKPICREARGSPW